MFTESVPSGSPGLFLRKHHLSLLAGILLLFAAASGQAAPWQHERGELELSGTPERIVALDWAATEALLLLGVTPVGVGDRDYYPVWVKEPVLPPGAYNVGARRSPSLEAIAELRPDLIVTSGHLVSAWELLESIAPTFVMSIYDESGEPFERARAMLLTLGDILDREELAFAQLRELDAALAENRRRLDAAGLADRPIALINFMDDRHVRVNASNGIFGAALAGLGLKNAWQAPGNVWGFAVAGLEDLADRPDARIVVISPTAAGLGEQLAASPFWRWLPAVRQNEIYQIEPVWAYGGVGAVRRFAGLLTEALLAGGGNRVR